MENIKIILADDDEDDRSFFQQALAGSGIDANLLALEDGQQVIDFLSDLHSAPCPDILFLDINMPGMDGKVCLRKIRSQVQFKDTPIIMLTTSTDARDIDETYREGANMYISKLLFYADGENWIKKIFSSDWRQRLLRRIREKFAFTKESL